VLSNAAEHYTIQSFESALILKKISRFQTGNEAYIHLFLNKPLDLYIDYYNKPVCNVDHLIRFSGNPENWLGLLSKR
jgi:hypothetical protein